MGVLSSPVLFGVREFKQIFRGVGTWQYVCILFSGEQGFWETESKEANVEKIPSTLERKSWDENASR